MCWSIWSLNISLPLSTLGHLTVVCAKGGILLALPWWGWEFEPEVSSPAEYKCYIVKYGGVGETSSFCEQEARRKGLRFKA